MARVVKEPKIRRAEFIEAAKKLFLEKGVANTSVSDIVKEVGVAQGTFYWHFKSKQEVLSAVVKEMCDKTCLKAKEVVESPKLNALEKLMLFEHKVLKEIVDDRDIIESFHASYDTKIHDCMLGEMQAQMLPLLLNVIQQGIAEKVFDTPYPEQAAAFIFASTHILNEHVINSKNDLRKWKEALADFAYKGLGVNSKLLNKSKNMKIISGGKYDN